jgi:voltage-gated potassium channel
MPTLVAILLTKVKRSQALALALFAVLAVVVGAGAFAAAEHVSFGIGLYWAITTATTVGYGDVTPHNTLGRVIAVGVMLTAVPLFGGAFAILAASVAATRLAKLLHVQERPPKGEFVAIYGMHSAVKRLAEEVTRAGSRVVVIATDDLDSLPETVETIQGDPTLEEVLRRSEPHRASRLLVALEDDKDALLVTVVLRHLAPEVPIIAVADSARVAEALADLGVHTTVSSEDLLAHTLAKSIETPHAGDLLLEIVRSGDIFFQEHPVPPEAVGRPLSEFRASTEGLVLGMVRGGEVHLGVATDPELLATDAVLVLRRQQPR